MKPPFFFLFSTLCLLLTEPCSKAGLVIDPTFDSSFTGYTNYMAYEAVINHAIATVESTIANPITVNITFSYTSSGLSGSSPNYNYISYQQYHNDLKTKQILSTNDNTALATLPNTATSPVSGISDMLVTLPLLRALGETSLGDNVPYGGTDGTIFVNLASFSTNLTATPGKYSLEWATMHEIDETLSAGDWGTTLGTGLESSYIGTTDLYRFSAVNTRSFTTNTTASSYFSINNGTSNILPFIQGAGYGDWKTGGYVQSAAASQNKVVSYATPELTQLDIIGYNLAAVPEPSTVALLWFGSVALIMGLRRKLRVEIIG